MPDMRCNRFLLVALCAFVVASVSHAEDRAATQARLQRADAATRLVDPELKPSAMSEAIVVRVLLGPDGRVHFHSPGADARASAGDGCDGGRAALDV
jgi:hypothetical protein